MTSKASRHLNQTKNWEARTRIGTLCIEIKDIAESLEYEVDEKRWENLEKMLHEIEAKVARALADLDDPKGKRNE